MFLADGARRGRLRELSVTRRDSPPHEGPQQTARAVPAGSRPQLVHRSRNRRNAGPTILRPSFVAPPHHTYGYASSSRLAGPQACQPACRQSQMRSRRQSRASRRASHGRSGPPPTDRAPPPGRAQRGPLANEASWSLEERDTGPGAGDAAGPETNRLSEGSFRPTRPLRRSSRRSGPWDHQPMLLTRSTNRGTRCV